MKVFVSHSSADDAAVLRLAEALRARGIEVWLDHWEIVAGDSIVEAINRGLDTADAGLIVFSAASKESRWVDAETDYLTYARIQEGKPLIPVELGDAPYVPPLLRPIARHGIDEVEAIVTALQTRRREPLAQHRPTESGHLESVTVRLLAEGEKGLRVEVHLGGHLYGSLTWDQLPADVLQGQQLFLQGFRSGLRRSPSDAERQSLDASIAELGRALRRLCLTEDAEAAIADLVDGGVGHTVELCFEADRPDLLGLPFEAMRLADDRLLAVQPGVTFLRRPLGLQRPATAPMAGPLKVLIAVGAPDEGQTASVVLDQERELQGILDAVEVAQRRENVEVRILEVGHPDVIAEACERDAYHALHLSCHGSPGSLELEDEEGRAVPVSAEQLLDALKRSGRPLPLVVLNACHGGVVAGQTASFAEQLLRGGVPFVLAMQTSVSDYYATELAREFYEYLAHREPPVPSRALAHARQILERARRKAIERSAPLHETQPEYATATVYVAGTERQLADFSLDKRPLNSRPVFTMDGPVPQLRIDDLIGRRSELRETLRTLRAAERQFAGVVLTGIGGVGKSAIAGRAMQRLKETGQIPAAHLGRFDLNAVARAVGQELKRSKRDDELAATLTSSEVDDASRLSELQRALAEQPIVLVLDDFEQNLDPARRAFRDPDLQRYLESLTTRVQTGRLLITSRYPLPGFKHLRHLPVGPLTSAQSRKLLQRLPALREQPVDEILKALRTVAGHPRMMELLDGLLNAGVGRLPHVTNKLQELARRPPDHPGDRTVAETNSVNQAVLLGSRDIVLTELLKIARAEGLEAILLQAAVSNLPVSTSGVAHMLAGEPAEDDRVRSGFERLAELSLLVLDATGSAWAHRWTAEGLGTLVDEPAWRQYHLRAGRYRQWRARNESRHLDDLIESMRNFLAGRSYDDAVEMALLCFELLRRFRQSLQVAALAAEVLETLPQADPGFAPIAWEEAAAHAAFGYTDRAASRLREVHEVLLHRADAEPDRADYQRDLSVSYNKMGDLFSALGQGDNARKAFQQALNIREKLADAEPDRADYQRDLSVSHERMGDLFSALGQGDNARKAFQQALNIREKLADAEPDRADYQRDLSVSYNKMGDLFSALGQGDKAREFYEKDLAIAQKLADAEPDRADYQRDLSVSYNKMGDLFRALGQGDNARKAFQQALNIREKLADAEPDRADYQRDLSVSDTRGWAISSAHSDRATTLERPSSKHSTSPRSSPTPSPIAPTTSVT